jgi:O-antigen/teichoic acid export membrane protein
VSLSFSIVGRDVSVSKTASWTLKGGLTVLDQGLFAGGNFLINVLLARWIAPVEYGAFALAYSIFLLLGTFYSAFQTEPLLVFGPGKYLSRLQAYLGVLLREHVFISGLLGLLLLVAAFVVDKFDSALGWALAGMALAAPSVLLIRLARSAFYIRSRPAWPATSGVIYCAGLFAATMLLRATGSLTPFTAFAVMGGLSLVTSVLLLSILRVRWRQEDLETQGVAADHWKYGRWIAPTRALAWIPMNIYFAILPLWFGLSESGALKALLNFSMPVTQALSALGVLIVPCLVRYRTKGGNRGLEPVVRWFSGLAFLGTTLYAAILWIFRDQALYLLYGKNYEHYSSLVFLFACLAPFGACATQPFSSALAAMERPDLMFRSSAVAGVVAIGLGVPLIVKFGLAGALAGVTVSNLVLGLMNYLYYQREQAPKEAPLQVTIPV